MATQNKLGSVMSYTKGEDSERAFALSSFSAGYWVTKANDKDDKLGYDFVISNRKHESFKVEVKSFKPNHPNEILLELKGVTGHDGWLYKQADLIAFQVESGFLLCNRADLIPMTIGKPIHHRVSRPDEAVVFVDRQEIESVAIRRF